MVQGRLTLLALVALFALPSATGWLAYRYWQPGHTTNYGELLAPEPLRTAGLRSVSGTVFDAQPLRGKWVLIQAAGAECDPACSRSLYLTHQARLAQGREMGRIARLLLTRTSPSGAVDSDLQLAVPGDADGPLSAGLYLMDPLGRVMMRYPQPPDGAGLIKDLRRLLRVH